MEKRPTLPGLCERAKQPRSRAKFVTLAAANAASVAALYWNQTILGDVGRSFPNSYLLSLVPSMTLAGYATGVALVAFGPAPRARLSVERHLSFLAAALVTASFAPSVLTLAAASFLVGCGAAAAPRLLAGAANLVHPNAAGTAIGRVICGSLVSILCVRLFGGALAAIVGWRAIFLIAASIIAAITLLTFATQGLRRAQPTGVTSPSSVSQLWKSHPVLRQAALQQAALLCAYNASWIAVLVELPVDQRPFVVIGGSCTGIVAALLAGWLSDKLCQHRVARAGTIAVFAAAALVLPAAYGSSPGLFQVLLLLAGMGLVDGGLQVSLVANQRRVQALEPGSRARLAATLTVCGFLGGAVGAGAGHFLWQTLGWQAAIGLIAAAAGIGLSCSLPASVVRLSKRSLRGGGGDLQLEAATLRTSQARPVCRSNPFRSLWPAAFNQEAIGLRGIRPQQPVQPSTQMRVTATCHGMTRIVRKTPA